MSSNATRRRSFIVDDVRRAANGSWREILIHHGVPEWALTGRETACPRYQCGGDTRFRYTNLNGDGSALCSHCGPKLGNGFDVLIWFTGKSFGEVLRMVAEYLGVAGEVDESPEPSQSNEVANGHEPTENDSETDIIRVMEGLKRVPHGAFLAFGARAAKRGSVTVCRLPMYGEDRKQCSNFDLAPGTAVLRKGMNAAKKPAGLFVQTSPDPNKAGGTLTTWPEPGDEVLLTEGCKDAAALYSLGFMTIGLPSSKLQTKFAALFDGCHVTIVPDLDKAGEAGARETAKVLQPVAASVQIARLPGEIKESDGDGVREILAMPNGEQLVRDAIAGATAWSPGDEKTGGDGTVERRIRNFELEWVATPNGEELKPVPIGITEIESKVKALGDDCPIRVQSDLHVVRPNEFKVIRLPDIHALMSFLGEVTGDPPDFKNGSGFHTKNDLFAQLQRNATEFISIETIPHEPPLPNRKYVHPVIESGNGDYLRTLVGRFSPESEVDSDLITAAFATPFAGLPGGTRPAVVITADGRGAGKSKLAEFIGELAGGFVDVGSNDDHATVRSRLLSPEGMKRRVVWLDNIKTTKFSSAELEALITTPVVSGKQLYRGEGQRPNDLTFLVTMNGLSLSKDMAQRSVIIRLTKPEYSGNWESDTREFMNEHRSQIISDIIGLLRSAPKELSGHNRWGLWERAVLSKLPEPEECRKVIAERSSGVDCDSEDSLMIEQFFAKRLERLGYDIQRDRVFIPGFIAARWMSAVFGENVSPTKSTQILKQKYEEGEFRQISCCASRKNGRGFEFWGSDAIGGETWLQLNLEQQIEQYGELFKGFRI